MESLARESIAIPDAESLISVSRASGIKVRHDRMAALDEDPRTAVARLSVLKAIEELYFSDAASETSESAILMDTVFKNLEET